MDELSEIEQRIRQAFDGVTTVVAPSWATTSDEIDDCYQAFGGRSWKDITVESAIQSFDCITFFDQDEIFGILPIWIIASLRHHEENVYFWTVLHLGGGEHSRLAGQRLADMATPEQKAAVRAFLTYFIERYQDTEMEEEALAVWS